MKNLKINQLLPKIIKMTYGKTAQGGVTKNTKQEVSYGI